MSFTPWTARQIIDSDKRSRLLRAADHHEAGRRELARRYLNLDGMRLSDLCIEAKIIADEEAAVAEQS